MKIRFWLVPLLLFPITGMAATQYVNINLPLNLRTGQGNQYRILKSLPNGSILTVLQTAPSGYTQVRTSDGTEGWVRTQYLSTTPPAVIELPRTQAKLAKVQAQLSQTQQTLSALSKQKSQLDSQYSKLQGEHKATTAELTKLSKIAAHPQELESENVDLREKFSKMSDEYTLIKQENQVLKDRSKRNWFLAGALVVIIGMVIGLLIPKLRFRRKDGWDF